MERLLEIIIYVALILIIIGFAVWLLDRYVFLSAPLVLQLSEPAHYFNYAYSSG